MSNRHRWLRLLTVPLLALALATAVPTVSAWADRYDDDRYDDRARYEERHRSGYNSDYMFAATRSVTDMDVSPALKVPLIPITIVMDLAALPFEALAGLF